MDANVINIKLMADIMDLQSKMQQAQKLVGDSMKGIEEAVGLAKKAMVAFAGVASVDAFMGMVRSNIEAAAALGKLATQAGLTTEAMSKMASVGKLSGTSADTIAAAMNKMTKAVSGTEEDAKGAGAALAALGISFADFDKMSADQRMIAVAQAMDKFKDGTGKSAAAMALMGKSGAEMLPYMKDLAVAGDIQAKITDEQAAQAKNFEQNLKRLSATSEAWKKDLSLGLLPALDQLLQAFLDLEKKGVGLRGAISSLSKDGTLNSWTHDLIVALTYAMDAFSGLGVLAKTAAISVNGFWMLLGATGDGEKYKQIMSGISAAMKETWGDTTYGQKLRDRMEQLKGIKAVAEAVKPELDGSFNRKNDKLKDDPEIKAYNTLIKSIGEKNAVTLLELATTEKLTEGEKDAAKFTESLANGTLKLTDVHKASITIKLEEQIANDHLLESRKKEEKATLAAADAHLKYVQTLEQGVVKMQADVAAQQEQNDRMGLTKEAIAALDAAKLESQAVALEVIATKQLDKDLDEYQYVLTMKQAKALRDLGAAKQEGAIKEGDIASFNALWQSVDKTAHDVFVNIFQGGQNAFTKLRDVLKATLLDLLYQMTVRKWIFDITASVSGGSGVSGAAIQAASGGSSGISSIFGAGGATSAFGLGMEGTISTIAEQGFIGGFANAMTSASTLASAGSFMGAAGAAIPYVGAALAAIAVIQSLSAGPTFTPAGGATVANIGAGGASSVARVDYTQESGRGGTTMNGAWSQADAATTKYIDDNVKAITAANRAYGAAIGLSSAALDSYTAQITVNTTGMDAAQAKAAYDAALTKFAADQSAAAYGDAIAAFALDGETASQTMARLGTDLTAANGWLGLFGDKLFDVSVIGAAAAAKLVTAFGSLEAMNSALDTYYKNYYTADEQRAATVSGVQSDLHNAGIDLSAEQLNTATKEGIRAWVDVAKSLYDAGIFTADQLAAAVNAANKMSSIAGSNSDAAATEAQRKIDEEKADPWYWLLRGTNHYGGADGTTGGGGGGMGSGNAKGASDASSSNYQATIKTFLESLNTTSAGGLSIFAQRDNAWASYSTQLALARGGDATAQSGITGFAKTYLDTLGATSRTALEQAIGIAKIKSDLGGLLDKTPEQQIVDAITTVNQTLRVGFGALGGSTDTTFASSSAQQRYVVATANTSGPDMTPVVTELRELRTQFSDMQTNIRSIEKTNAKLQKDMTSVTQNGEAIQTVAV